MTVNGDMTTADESPSGRPSRLADLLDGPRCPAPAPSTPLEPPSLTSARREFAALLGEFRRTAVLVPVDPHGGPWIAEHGGVRWICAFSNEETLARFAHARGEAGREWEYRAVLGARLLDVLVPKLGVPAGVALDAGSEDGVVFPPVEGIVPDAAVVELGGKQ
ncbi:SseB family protein [Streptomyces sp. NRRL S-118]|uniref:SseB family protein n=1 Tax=Streptomyces sp. NRRL S-118 TaxID=1463881 RepID=UPI001F4435FC|nr:SseB family protein [Streptomyces sp. NRRL S-118]